MVEADGVYDTASAPVVASYELVAPSRPTPSSESNVCTPPGHAAYGRARVFVCVVSCCVFHSKSHWLSLRVLALYIVCTVVCSMGQSTV